MAVETLCVYRSQAGELVSHNAFHCAGKKRLPLLGGLEQGAHVHPTLVGTNKETIRKRNQKAFSPDLMANGYFSNCH